MTGDEGNGTDYSVTINSVGSHSADSAWTKIRINEPPQPGFELLSSTNIQFLFQTPVPVPPVSKTLLKPDNPC